MLEKIYFSPWILDVPNATKKNTLDKVLIQIKDLNEIDYSSINWDIMDDKKEHRFAFIPYYLLIIKGGIISPTYIKKEN